METVIVACSGGPDSMALLDLVCQDPSLRCVVAHVNYKKRESADRDEEYVRSYCQAHSLSFHVLVPQWDHQGNFQAWAREVRYAFFEKLARKYHTRKIYVAHHMDDHIETYWIQQERGILCENYGLASEYLRKGYEIHRPLLKWEKKELEAYCRQRKIFYGIDESNLTDDYLRNRLRHHRLEGMTKAQKENICEEITQANERWKQEKAKIQAFLQDWDGSVDRLIRSSLSWLFLDGYLYSITGRHFGKVYLRSLCTQIQTDTLIDLGDVWLESYRGKLKAEKKWKESYNIYHTIQFGQKDSYVLTKEGKTIEGCTITKKDLPIVIRPVRDGDAIELRYGKKKVSRFFIDRKISYLERKKWLVIENREGKIIFVPGIGCEKEHFSANPTFFMIQCTL